MKPISNVGKLIGPGQQHAFAFNGGSLTVANVTDHQDGRYTFVLEGDANQNVDVTLLGETVLSGPLSDLGEDGKDFPWLWLVLIFIFVVVLFIYRKLSGS